MDALDQEHHEQGDHCLDDALDDEQGLRVDGIAHDVYIQGAVLLYSSGVTTMYLVEYPPITTPHAMYMPSRSTKLAIRL